MTVYVIIIQDRHSDVDAEVWTDEEKAISRAKEIAHENAQFQEQVRDILFYPDYDLFAGIVYSTEGDMVTIRRKEIQE
jgi:hypothetical protein